MTGSPPGKFVFCWSPFREGKGGLDNGYHYEVVSCWFRLTYHCLWYLTRWVVRNQRRVASILFFLWKDMAGIARSLRACWLKRPEGKPDGLWGRGSSPLPGHQMYIELISSTTEKDCLRHYSNPVLKSYHLSYVKRRSIRLLAHSPLALAGTMHKFGNYYGILWIERMPWVRGAYANVAYSLRPTFPASNGLCH